LVGYCHGILSECLGGLYKVVDPYGPIQQAVLGMAMEMDETHL
jgi:hypothetical protein